MRHENLTYWLPFDSVWFRVFFFILFHMHLCAVFVGCSIHCLVVWSESDCQLIRFDIYDFFLTHFQWNRWVCATSCRSHSKPTENSSIISRTNCCHSKLVKRFAQVQNQHRNRYSLNALKIISAWHECAIFCC